MAAAGNPRSGLALADVLRRPLPPGAAVAVYGLASDSRRLQRGWAFAACAGRRGHGLEYVAQAVSAGAAAVLWEPAPGVASEAAAVCCRSAGIPLVAYPGLGQELGELADRAFGEPSRTLTVLGVTGTDGKSSVSQFLAQVLHGAGGCGVIGTLGHGAVGALQPLPNTTPDAATVHELLAQFRGCGWRYASMEVSSHGLDQGRVCGVRFHTAILTNLGRDHLDYHGSLAAYAQAKRRLFRMPGLRCAVINADDAFGRSLRRELAPGVRCIAYSLAPEADANVCCPTLELRPQGLRLQAMIPDGLVEAELPVMGRFNAANVLAVIAALVGLGWSAPRIAQGLQAIVPVPGRMERFVAPGRPLVVVDYAHTAEALRAALGALREHVAGRIWCVFGCGGERDPGKRPVMGAVAERGADVVIVTDDNPRGEDPQRIVADILAGFRRARPRIERDRVAAIACAIAEAGPGDAVLVAGKGHEDYQITADGVRAYSDRATVRALLGEGES